MPSAHEVLRTSSPLSRKFRSRTSNLRRDRRQGAGIDAAASSRTTSHSSRHQAGCVHQAPLVRHGPEHVSQREPSALRNTSPKERSAQLDVLLHAVDAPCASAEIASDAMWLPLVQLSPTVTKFATRNASGAWLSSSSGEPTRSSPTSLRRRANSISRRPASGACGANNPCCAVLRTRRMRAHGERSR